MEKLVHCIRKHTRKGFAVSMQIKDYDLVNRDHQLQEAHGTPYAFCGIICLVNLRDWAKNKGINIADILCIFEEGDEDQNDLLKRAKAEGFNVIAQSKERVRAFDACDLAAWKARAIVDDAWNRKVWQTDPEGADRVKRSMDQIEIVLQVNGMYSRNSLLNSCYQTNTPKRSNVG
jgi:hypothetical protein